MRYAYPCRPHPEEEGGYSVSFRHLPGAVTQGETLGEALENAQEALELTLAGMLENGEQIPDAGGRPEPGEELIVLPPRFAAKMALLLHMRRNGVSPEELGSRTGMNPQKIEELMDPAVSSPLETSAAALQTLCRRIVIDDIPEEEGEHLHQPAMPGPMSEDEFIRRLRRYALHRNIDWKLLDESPGGNMRIQVRHQVAQLPKGEIPALERGRILDYLDIQEAEF